MAFESGTGAVVIVWMLWMRHVFGESPVDITNFVASCRSFSVSPTRGGLIGMLLEVRPAGDSVSRVFGTHVVSKHNTT